MNVSRLISCIVCLLIAIALGGCGDHRIPDVTPGSGTSKLRVKTIALDQPNNTAEVSSFQYDAQGRLGMIITYQTPDSTVAPVETSVYQYDGQNRLTQLKRDIVRRGSATETYTYGYNPAGQVSGISYSGPNSIYRWSVTPIYNEENRVTSNSKQFNVPGVSTQEHSTFTYTGNNLTYVTTTGQATQKGLTLPAETVNTSYTYDTGLNPFYGVFVIPAPSIFGTPPSGGIIGLYTYYGGIANTLNLSQNNVLSDGKRTYSYSYNSANLPTSRVTKNNGIVEETLHYEYESY